MDMPVTEETLAFEGWRFERRTGALLHQDGSGAWAPAQLGTRALNILAILLDRPGALVSKDAIMDMAWPNVAVAPNNLTVQMAALRRVLDEGRTGDSCIQTVPGRGYRFLLAVVPADRAVDAVSAPAQPLKLPPEPQVPRRLRLSAGFAIALAIFVAGVWWLHRAGEKHLAVTDSRASASQPLGRGPEEAPPLSIAILPFNNISGDTAEDYIADGIADDITSDLSRTRGMFVLARSAAFSLKGTSIDPQRIGKQLGVRYLLEGSVRKIDDTARVNARLVDANSGQDIWADRFDQPLKDLGAGQDAIVRRIGTALNIQLVDVESARSKRERPTDPAAFDLILRARSILLHPKGLSEQNEAIALLEQALQLDPNSVRAMADLAFLLLDRFRDGIDFQRATELLAQATAISPDDEGVLSFTGVLYQFQGKDAEALTKFERLLEINPNLPMAYNNMGQTLIKLGRSEEAIAAFEEANRLDPGGSYAFQRYNNLAFASLLLGHNEEAIVWERRALAANPNLRPDRRAFRTLYIAAAEIRLGHRDEAHRLVTEANSIWPYITVRQFFPKDFSSPLYVEQIGHLVESIRLAGERDHADEDADFGVTPDDGLHQEITGLTPTTAPGVTTIRTTDLLELLERTRPLIIDPMYSPVRSIPGAVGLFGAGSGGNYTDATQDRLRQKVRELTGGDYTRPIVAVGWNVERFNGRNLALRLKALGYSQVYWYRGGREAWEVQGLTEAEMTPQKW
jgi:adenylate cyclase